MAALVARWAALAPRIRVLLGALALAALGAAVFAVALQRDSRVPLFAAPLSSDALAEVAERLSEWNVPFVPTQTNVRVDPQRRGDLLLRLSLAGVPHGHLASTAEALAKAGPLTPQMVLEAQQRDGLAGDVASGLRGLPGVADARVIIAPAERGTFADDPSHGATAAVRLALAPGATLPAATVDGIRHYVAGAVAGLAPEHVTILDDRGLALGGTAAAAASNGPPASDAGMLEASLQSALDAALGTGAAIVRLRVDYDARSRERHAVTRKPLGSRPVLTTSNDETYRSATKTYSKRQGSVDRGSEVDDEKIETPAGRIERISVGIALDAAHAGDAKKIEALAIATLGLVPARGDTVSIETMAFPHPVARMPSAGAGWLGLATSLAPAAILACAVVLGIRFAARPAAVFGETVVSRIAASRTSRAVAAFPPDRVRGALAKEPPHTAAAIISALPAATATAVLEMYSPEERAAIVRRMARGTAPAMPDYETVLRRG